MGRIFPLISLLMLFISGCADRSTANPSSQGVPVKASASTSPAAAIPVTSEKAVFAAGCFWGVEATFRKVPGVLSTRVGYTGGQTLNPTYRDVCTHTTGHAEAVEITYDPAKVSYQQLLVVFFENHDPTTVDSQGPDFGDNYRSAVFYASPEQQKLAEAEKERRDKSGDYVGPIVTQIVPAATFYTAEDYHQQYYEKQGVSWSCHFGNGKKH